MYNEFSYAQECINESARNCSSTLQNVVQVSIDFLKIKTFYQKKFGKIGMLLTGFFLNTASPCKEVRDRRDFGGSLSVARHGALALSGFGTTS